MKYLLDTDTLIDYVKDHGDTRARLDVLIESGDEVGLCAVTVGELYSGLASKARDSWESWLKVLPYWHIGINAAMRAGIYRKRASESGRTLAITDALLAGLAHQHHATILTSNIKDYPMTDVLVLSLRKQAA
jgi:predicted nucleic acid-binding protein